MFPQALLFSQIQSEFELPPLTLCKEIAKYGSCRIGSDSNGFTGMKATYHVLGFD